MNVARKGGKAESKLSLAEDLAAGKGGELGAGLEVGLDSWLTLLVWFLGL